MFLLLFIILSYFIHARWRDGLQKMNFIDILLDCSAFIKTYLCFIQNFKYTQTFLTVSYGKSPGTYAIKKMNTFIF